MIERIITASKITNKLLGLVEQDKEYFTLYHQYQKACQSLSINLVEQLNSAYAERIKSAVLFCASLGFQENLALFKDPLRRCFLEVDPETYLQEKVLFRMAPYLDAERKIYKLLKELPERIGDIITEYYVYLEMNAEKIAHYKGFIYANEILTYTHPGYSPNMAITHAYERKLPDILGFTLQE